MGGEGWSEELSGCYGIRWELKVRGSCSWDAARVWGRPACTLPHVDPACLPRPATIRCAEVGSLSSGWDEGGGAPAASLASLLGALCKPAVAWSDKVSLFQQVQAALQQAGSAPHLAADCASNADRLVAALLEGSGDAHFRVAAAALAALAAGLAGPCSRLFEPQLDRVMTSLFARWGARAAGQPPRDCSRRWCGDW